MLNSIQLLTGKVVASCHCLLLTVVPNSSSAQESDITVYILCRCRLLVAFQIMTTCTLEEAEMPVMGETATHQARPARTVASAGLHSQ